jgi:hypothetical protein
MRITPLAVPTASLCAVLWPLTVGKLLMIAFSTAWACSWQLFLNSGRFGSSGLSAASTSLTTSPATCGAFCRGP